MDLASGHIRALRYLSDNEAQVISFNLGTGKGASVLELVNIYQTVNNMKII